MTFHGYKVQNERVVNLFPSVFESKKVHLPYFLPGKIIATKLSNVSRLVLLGFSTKIVKRNPSGVLLIIPSRKFYTYNDLKIYVFTHSLFYQQYYNFQSRVSN